MSNDDWVGDFKSLYERAVDRYREGRQSARSMFEPAEVEFLGSIGCTAQELFDFVEDGVHAGEPSFEEVLAVTGIRRNYFLNELGGKTADRIVHTSELPPKSEAVDGIRWLPRILEKAKAKLNGQLSEDLMYGCGGDRPFLRSVHIGLAEFLEKVRDSKDDREVIDFVKSRAGG